MHTRHLLSPIVAACLAAGALLNPAPGHCQVNPQFDDLATAVEEARTALGTERKNLVLQSLNLNAEESARFWPLYDQYLLDLKRVGDLRVKMITDFAANYDSLTDKTADVLLSDGLEYFEQLNDLRKRYLRKFKRALPSAKVARLYQLEYKLDAITSFALARQIPLVPQPPTSAPIPMPRSPAN